MESKDEQKMMFTIALICKRAKWRLSADKINSADKTWKQ